MKPAPFDYVAPKTLEETLDILERADGGATILAGGQTLLPLLALRLSLPALVVDINRVEGLSGVRRSADGVRIGAMTRQSELLTDPVLADALPLLVEAVRHVGHLQTRNRGTIGGSIALGEPAAEQPAVAVALGALIEVQSKRGVRKLKADEFYQGPYATLIAPDEIITAIHFPAWPARAHTLFREVSRRPGDFALVGLAGAIATEGGQITDAGLAWFGMGPTPMKARQAEAALIGQRVAAIDSEAIAELAVSDTDPFDDHHATAEYRRTVARRVAARALGEAFTRKAA